MHQLIALQILCSSRVRRRPNREHLNHQVSTRAFPLNICKPGNCLQPREPRMSCRMSHRCPLTLGFSFPAAFSVDSCALHVRFRMQPSCELYSSSEMLLSSFDLVCMHRPGLMKLFCAARKDQFTSSHHINHLRLLSALPVNGVPKWVDAHVAPALVCAPPSRTVEATSPSVYTVHKFHMIVIGRSECV